MPTLSTIGAACARAWGFTSGLVKDQYFNLVSLLLPGNGTNGAQNNTFLDSGTANSGSGFTITRNGNTTQGTFSPFSQTGWGNYFDGTDDYLSGIGTTSSFNALHQSSPQFTIEAYIYITSTGATYKTIFDTCGYSSAGIGVTFAITDTGKINLFINRGSSGTWVVNGNSTTSVPTNQWVHVAVTYDQSLASNNAKFYLDGVADGTANKTANAPSSSNASYAGAIGASGAASDDFFGYISNLRIVNGSSSAPALPISPLTAISGTLLLTCQSNRFKDNSSSNFNITANGIVAVTPFSPFAPTQSYSASAVGGSGYFDGNGDYLTFTKNATTGSFTCECWFYKVANSPTRHVLFGGNNTDLANANQLAVENNGDINYIIGTGSATVLTAGIPNNTWTHIAFVRSGSSLAVFVNGSRLAAPITNSNALNIDRIGNIGTTTAYVYGYISSSRIVDAAVYDPSQTTLTVPTAPLTAISNTYLLLNYTNAGVVDATAKNVLETVGNAQISTTQSKWGGGSMYFNGSSSFAKAPATPNYFIGSGDFTIELWLKRAATGSVQELFSKESASAAQAGIRCVILSGNTIQVSLSTNGSAYALTLTGATALTSTSDWYYIALVRSGSGTNNIKLYVNGSVDAQGTFASTLYETNTFWALGSRADLTTNTLNGYIDDFRVTVGQARTTTASPTAPFPLQ